MYCHKFFRSPEFLLNSISYEEEITPILQKLFQKIDEEEITSQVVTRGQHYPNTKA